ncbi:MAG TPA: glycosyltransferase family 1 protein [Bacteroidales bacterium]|nr:glycosyltransferase family 1 protein [Bacteroidales bacterium]
MHICFLTHEYPKQGFPHGGVGTFIKMLSKNLVSSGVEVSVVGINYSRDDEFENDYGVKVHRLAAKKVKGLTWYLNSSKVNRKLVEIHKADPIDIVESTELGLAFIKKIEGVKYLIRLHGGHHFFADAENKGINRWKSFQEKRSFAKADKIIGVSNYVLDHTAEYLDFKTKRGPAIYNPVDPDRFYQADQSKMKKGMILFVGTVCEKKGVRQLIQALPLIRKEIPEAHVVIAGRDWRFPDGSSYTEWVKQFISEDVKENVTFTGPVNNEEIPGLIEEAEVCVYPSHMEAMPMAWLEVLAMGKALIGSKAGPGPEIINDGVTGLLCDPLNPEDIAEKTIRNLKNQEMGFTLGKAARQEVRKRFSIKKLVQQNISFYQSLL